MLDKITGIEFPHPDRIRYDNRSLIIDGKPVFIFSGAMHYFRVPRELWKDRLQKLKDAGLNCVETYVPWNLHEPQEPASPDDYSKLRDMEQISDSSRRRATWGCMSSSVPARTFARVGSRRPAGLADEPSAG